MGGTLMILGGVGLGICSACRVPGAFWYPSAICGLPGVWMCDSCQCPETVTVRVRAHLDRVRTPFRSTSIPTHDARSPTP